MKKLTLVLLLFLLSATAAAAQTSWREELGEDLVAMRDGKMVIEDYTLNRISLPGYPVNEFQVAYYAEAPEDGLISRDNFVAISAALGLFVLQQSLAQAYNVSAADFFAAYDSEDISAPIGRPDLEINIYMTDDGLQFEIRNTVSGETGRWTDTWASFFASSR